MTHNLWSTRVKKNNDDLQSANNMDESSCLESSAVQAKAAKGGEVQRAVVVYLAGWLVGWLFDC